MKKCSHFDTFVEQALCQNHLEKICNFLLELNFNEKSDNQINSNKKYLSCENCYLGNLNQETQNRLCLCASCLFVGCFSLNNNSHIQNHALQTGHWLIIDITYGVFYCFGCKDFQYNQTVEDFLNESFSKANFLPYGKFSEWQPSQKSLRILRKITLNSNLAVNQNPIGLKSYRIKPTSIIGLRGLINLGNTCFMNCILQTLTHIPSLRDYFLGDQHICCNKKNDNSNNKNICLVCEIMSLFQEFYSGKRSPYIPFRLLHQVWTQVKHLAGYEQQDAHEFFIAALNSIHRNFIENDVNCKALNLDKKKFINYNNCHCIIDKIFTGGLQSDVICSNCNNISTTVDPFWDISLDIFKNTSKSMKSSSNQLPKEALKLEDCLYKFTFPEILTSFNCSNCKSSREAKKQFTMKKLPVVCCFHLKRFEQTNRVHKKISDHISFPEILDMSPFMSNISSNPNYTSNKETSNIDNQSRRLQTNRYFLFAVVNHHGTLESGHYTSFIRLKNDQWFKCDDHIISKASLSDVMNSEGYLLFYHKIWHEYE